MNFEVVIGIEIHCELKTKSKMFSGAAVSFGKASNTLVNEIDMAFPGTLPQLNKYAVELALRACTSLNCTINPLVEFDRKNYYYSDLPKGYQITQDRFPIGRNGYLDVNVDGETKRIHIERIHMEEDTAKQTHDQDYTLIDFNRSGTPLIEIVTDASIRSGKEAAAYVEKLRAIMLFTDVSDVRMDEGSMRCDVNISLRPYGYKGYGNKVEIKNLNSIANVQKAVEFEIARQEKELLLNHEIIQETRRFDETTRETVAMRKKEGFVDYKYFTEPNILPITLDDEWIKDVQSRIPELPEAKQKRFMEVYGLNAYDSQVLTQSKEISEFYDEVLTTVKDPKIAANVMMSELMGYLNKNNLEIHETKLSAAMFSQMINMQVDQEISSKHVKKILEIMLEDGSDPQVIATTHKMKQISDPVIINEMIEKVLDANPKTIENYKNGRVNLLGYLVGQVIKESKGQANPGLVNSLMIEAIDKRG